MLSVVRKAEKITAKLFFALVLLAICFAVIAGADAVLAAATKDATSPVAPLASTEIFGQGEMEQRFFAPPRPLMEDWRQYAVGDAPKPALQAPDTVRVPMTLTNTPFLLLKLRANNIQVQEIWRVTNAANAFTVSNDGELYLTVNEMTILVATVYLEDNFQRLNVAYENLTASATITVAVDVDVEVEVEDSLILADAPRLYITAGVANDELHVFQAMGGTVPYTYSLTANPDPTAFTFSNGTLSVNDNAAIKVYTFTVVVMDAGGALATAVATAEVGDSQIFVLGGGDSSDNHRPSSDVWLSPDGKTWQQADSADWPGRRFHQAIAHQGRLYVLGGITDDYHHLSDVWSSADGRNWVLETAESGWTERRLHQAVSHQDKIYVLGGRDDEDNNLDDVWSSVDGKSWMLVTMDVAWHGRHSHQAVSYNGRIYVLGGYTSGLRRDVWSSADGKNWVLELSEATLPINWSNRQHYQVLSHQGNLYLLAGAGVNRKPYGSPIKNDVWSSSNGKNWGKRVSPGWIRRWGHQAVSYQGRVYLLGGQRDTGSSGSSNAILNDVWSSDDGNHWRRETANAGWPKLSYFQAVVFPPELSLNGVGEQLTVTAGEAINYLHTFTAQYGMGNYTYSGSGAGFSVSPAGVLSAGSATKVGEYTLTVWVEDALGNRARTVVRLKVE